MLREVLTTGDNTRLTVGRKPHRLRLVELGVLESGEPQKPIEHRRREALLFDIEKIRADDLYAFRKRTQDGDGQPLFGRRDSPRLFLVAVISKAAPYTNHIAGTHGLTHESFNKNLEPSAECLQETSIDRGTAGNLNPQTRCYRADAASTATVAL